MRFKEKVKSDDNRRRAFTYLTENKGLEPHVAAGILGNFMQESGQSLNVEAYNPDDMGSPSFGLAQWRGDRLTKLKKVAGDKASTLEGQLDFMMWEFNNTEKRAYKKLQEADTTEEAALAFSTYYERPHKDYAHNEKRTNYAKSLYNTYVGTPEEYDFYEDPQELYEEENTIENQQWESHTPQREPERLDYNVDIATNPPQVPYLGDMTEEEDSDESQTPIVDNAIARIEDKRNQMAALQQLVKASQVQYIDPNQTEEQPQSMAEGGETDSDEEAKQRPLTEEESIEESYGVFGIMPKDTKQLEPDEPVRIKNPQLLEKYRRRGRERQPLNMAVRETTAVRRDTSNPLLTPMVEKEITPENDPQALIDNPELLNVNKEERALEEERVALEEKVKGKSEFINPLGMDKIDPTSLQDEESVARLQGQLQEFGYDIGEHGVDGKMGGDTLAAIDKFNSKLSLENELSLGDFKTPEKTEQLQEFLISKGYDLNPDGKFQDDGVDGKLGEVTKQALMKYNREMAQDALPYKGYKMGEKSYLGKCAEEQCSEYVQNELWRNLQPQMSRAEWNKTTGLHGDAWDIGENIVRAGGRKLPINAVAAGDIVTIQTEGSSYRNQAGSNITHTAVVDQVNDDGSYYILHNVHKRENGKWQGHEYRDKVDPNSGKVGGNWASFFVKNAYRADIDGTGAGKVNPLRKEVTLDIDQDKLSNLEDMGSVLGSAPEKIQEYVKPLNDFKNKEKFAQIFDLEEDEYQSLAQLTIGVLGQESDFGTSSWAVVKEPLAKASWLANRLTDGNFADKSFMKTDEVSEGAGRLKYNTNFHADLTEFGINKKNFDKGENVPITSMYKLARDYKTFIKKGYSKKDALYRAAVTYNASLSGKSEGKSREEWAQDYDVDYANKVIQFASNLTAKGEDKQYKTIIDDLILEDNVHKWNKKAYVGRN